MSPRRNGNDPMTTPSPSSFPPPSEALRRVVDALLDGTPPPPDAQAALSPAEQDEVAGIARTAHLTRLSLHAASGEGENGENAALQKAQAALQNRAPASAHGDSSAAPSSWWARLLWKRKQE